MSARPRPRLRGVTIDLNDAIHTIRDKINAMEVAVLHQPQKERCRLAGYLLELANEILKDQPRIHIQAEHITAPILVTVLSITQKLYEQGNPINDEYPRKELFLP